MANVKGIKAILEPRARELWSLDKAYTIKAISQILGVSENTLRRWKEESRVPGEEQDGWDLARQESYELLFKINKLIQGLVREAKSSPGNSALADTAAKWAAVAKNMREDKRKAFESLMKLQSDQQQAEIDYPAIFLEILSWLIDTLAVMDPDASDALVRNLEQLTELYKKKHLK